MSRSSTTTDENDGLDPISPGEILREEFLKPLGISQNRLARDLAIPVSRVAGILDGTRSITPDTALRLAKYLETSPDVWLGLQAEYDLRRAPKEAHAKVKSSVIEDIEYDGADQLVVTFVNGRRYAYQGVSTALVRAFVAAESKGRFFNEHIRDAFQAIEITGRPVPTPRSAA